MSPALHAALLASVLTTMVAAPVLAQDRAGVSGTITLTPEPIDRIQLMETRRPRLGVVVAVQATRVDSIGALLVGVTPNGPAAKAGLRTGDIVVRFNGKLVTEGDKAGPGESVPGIQLIKLASELNPGDSAVVQYRRAKAQRQTTVVAGDEPGGSWIYTFQGPSGAGMLRSTPAPEGAVRSGLSYDLEFKADSFFFRADSMRGRTPLISRMRTPMPMAWALGSPLANLELAPINPELGKYFGTEEGVLVIDLPENSSLGLKPGDVVLAIDGRKVQAPNPLLRALMSYEMGERFTLQIMRQKSKQTVTGSVGQQ